MFAPRTSATHLPLLVMAVILVLTGPSITGNIPLSQGRYDPFDGTLDPYLEDVLEGRIENNDASGKIRALVQFRNQPIDDDIEYARSLGLDHISSLKVLPAALFEGNRDELRALSGYPRTVWMEYDGEMELMMEESLSTVNATVAWNSWVRNAREMYPQIDGRDVTVAVVDTGIDAGHPDLDYKDKTIINIKSDIPGAPWYEMENSDTSYGHGTHCAGTIAGNGDASAGARAGVAPAANLIGLCVGDVVITLTNTLEGLEWVYENSKPPNRYDIQVVSNSWGGGAAEYDPEDATSRICQKLTYENNVVVVFAMGNAGSGHHDGQELSASPTGLIPSNIGVAAFERDGSGVAYFSSRGQKGLNQTYPDVSAPGVSIWSAHARLTEISALSKIGGNPNPYYLAISGTSMATPHVSGLAALMFQAAPDLTISNRWEDYSGDQPDSWHSNEYNRIHEVEWIMERSARYLEPDGIALSDEDRDNGVPEPEDRGETETGWDGRKIDWAQGYGLIDAEKCVGVALTLQRLRDQYPREDWNVNDAFLIYEERGVFHDDTLELDTDTLHASWEGEFARYAQDDEGPILVQNQSRLIWVAEGAREVSVILQFETVQLSDRTIGDLTFVVDYGYDGVFDYQHPFFGSRTTGIKEEVLTVNEGNSGMYWAIGVYGRGLKLVRPVRDGEYMELRIPYTMGVTMNVEIPNDGMLEIRPPKPNSMVSTWEEGDPSPDHSTGRLILHGTTYDMALVEPLPSEEEETGEKGTPWSWIIIILILTAAAAALYFYWKKRNRRRRMQDRTRSAL